MRAAMFECAHFGEGQAGHVSHTASGFPEVEQAAHGGGDLGVAVGGFGVRLLGQAPAGSLGVGHELRGLQLRRLQQARSTLTRAGTDIPGLTCGLEEVGQNGGDLLLALFEGLGAPSGDGLGGAHGR